MGVPTALNHFLYCHREERMSVVIDFEGFQLDSGYFIVKELAFCANNSVGLWTFQPPFPYNELPSIIKVQYSWVTRNLHRIHWNEGELPYTNLRNILNLLFELYPNVYVKGVQKKNFLEFLSGRTCFDLEDLNCPKIKQFEKNNSKCSIHGADFPHCAFSKAITFHTFLTNL